MPSFAARVLEFSARLLIKRTVDAPTFDLRAVRRAMDSRRTLPSFLPRGVRITASGAPALQGEWHTPDDAVPGRTILHLHGGAFIAGTPKAFRPMSAWIAKRSAARVLTLDYRLAPEHPFPAGLDDCVAAVRALYASGVAPAQLGLVGDSAGGALVLATLCVLRDAGDPLPGAAVLISPLTDMAGTGESWRTNAATEAMLSSRHTRTLIEWYAGAHGATHPLVSPLHGEAKGLPPLLIHASDREVLLDDARRYADKAEAAGVAVTIKVFRGQVHDFHASVPLTRESRGAVGEVGAFFATRLR